MLSKDRKDLFSLSLCAGTVQYNEQYRTEYPWRSHLRVASPLTVNQVVQTRSTLGCLGVLRERKKNKHDATTQHHFRHYSMAGFHHGALPILQESVINNRRQLVACIAPLLQQPQYSHCNVRDCFGESHHSHSRRFFEISQDVPRS